MRRLHFQLLFFFITTGNSSVTCTRTQGSKLRTAPAVVPRAGKGRSLWFEHEVSRGHCGGSSLAAVARNRVRRHTALNRPLSPVLGDYSEVEACRILLSIFILFGVTLGKLCFGGASEGKAGIG